MSDSLEETRLESGQDASVLPGMGWFYDVQLGAAPGDVIERIKSIVRQVVAASSGPWPSDDEWRGKLPPWLLRELPTLSREECQSLMDKTPKNLWHTLPWEFGSWLDAIKRRNWRWWGCSVNGNKLNLVLEILNEPASLEAFEVIVRAAGGVITADRRVTARA
ncbi:MAG TPA: hypothetical protein VN750_08045 [Steroidobacteraceae bacterium]|nr:hypothetical protein [Steroidobacteraceae bacterium]